MRETPWKTAEPGGDPIDGRVMQQLRRPLNEIPAAARDEVVRRVLRRTATAVPVEVAKFGSSI